MPLNWFEQWLKRIVPSLFPEPAISLPPDSSLLDLDEFVPEGFVHGLEIMNDDRTPMDFVVSSLQRHAGLQYQDAVRAMQQIHRCGGMLISMSSFSDASQAAAHILREAAEHNFPLSCRAVQKEIGIEQGE